MYSDKPTRFIGLDLHKYYLVATAVDADLNKVYGPRRVDLIDLQDWIRKTITPRDALVVETTANAFQVYDALLPHAHSVTVVHPPHVALIVRSQVKTDKIAAYHLARLLAKELLVSIWIPPQEVRELRTLVAQRKKMISLKTSGQEPSARRAASLFSPFAGWTAVPSNSTRLVGPASVGQVGARPHPVRPGHPGFRPKPDRRARNPHGRLGGPGRTGVHALRAERPRNGHGRHPAGGDWRRRSFSER